MERNIVSRRAPLLPLLLQRRLQRKGLPRRSPPAKKKPVKRFKANLHSPTTGLLSLMTIRAARRSLSRPVVVKLLDLSLKTMLMPLSWRVLVSLDPRLSILVAVLVKTLSALKWSTERVILMV